VLRPLLLDTLTPEAIAATGIFEGKRIHEMIRKHMERRANLGYQLWGLLILFLWMKRWHVQTAAMAMSEKESDFTLSTAMI